MAARSVGRDATTLHSVRKTVKRHWVLFLLPLVAAAAAAVIWFWVWYEDMASQSDDNNATNSSSSAKGSKFPGFGSGETATVRAYDPEQAISQLRAENVLRNVSSSSNTGDDDNYNTNWFSWGWSVMGLLALDNNLACGATENTAGMIRGMEKLPANLVDDNVMNMLAMFDATGYRPWMQKCGFANYGINDTQCPVCFDWKPKYGVKNLDIRSDGVVVGKTWDEADLSDEVWIDQVINDGMASAYRRRREPFNRIPAESMLVLSSHGNAWESFAEDWRCYPRQRFGKCKAVQPLPNTIQGVRDGIRNFNNANSNASAAFMMPELNRLGIVMFHGSCRGNQWIRWNDESVHRLSVDDSRARAKLQGDHRKDGVDAKCYGAADGKAHSRHLSRLLHVFQNAAMHTRQRRHGEVGAVRGTLRRVHSNAHQCRGT